MRTLLTQVRLRRLIRSQSEYTRRLRQEPPGRDLPEAARTRLLEMVRHARQAWEQESGNLDWDGAEFIRHHVRRSFAAIDVAIAALSGALPDLARVEADFNDAALPLVFFLRGLEAMEPASMLTELTA